MNQKIRIAACDDDATVLSVLPDALNNVFKGQADVDCFSSGRELLEQMKKAIYDIIILDINMPDMNGLALGKRIRAVNATVELVYLSNREDKVFDTFAVSPMTFIRKSAFFSDIAKLAVLYEHNHARGGEGERLIVKDKDSVQSRIFNGLEKMEKIRRIEPVFNADAEVYTKDYNDNSILWVVRKVEGEELHAVFNFSDSGKTIWMPEKAEYTNLMTGIAEEVKTVELSGWDFLWMKRNLQHCPVSHDSVRY